jgi:hypothetical protein
MVGPPNGGFREAEGAFLLPQALRLADHRIRRTVPTNNTSGSLSSKASGEMTSTERDSDMAAIFDLAKEWPPGDPFPRE